MFEVQLLFGLWSTFLLQIFSRKRLCNWKISKIVRPVLADLSVNGLILSMLRLLSSKAEELKKLWKSSKSYSNMNKKKSSWFSYGKYLSLIIFYKDFFHKASMKIAKGWMGIRGIIS